MPTDAELREQLDRLDGELTTRAARVKRLDQYTGVENCPLPDAIVKARITKAYRLLMGMSNAPWGSLVVGAVTDRLRPTGIVSPENSDADIKALWDVWQENHMDSDCLLAHDAALTHGRSVALVWPETRPGPRFGRPVITLDNASQVVIEYAPSSRRERTAALRGWVDEKKRKHWTLYRLDGVWKFSEDRSALSGLTSTTGLGRYVPRVTPGEPWPVPNPFGVIPAIDLPVNGKLQAGTFPYARGEFEHCLGLLDRINTLTFLGLVVAFWMGFPLRAVIGDKIRREVLKDDEGQAILDDDGEKQYRRVPPFEAGADSVAQFENPNARLEQFDAADRGSLSIYGELDQFASITQTPRYYFPLEGGMSNLSAEAITATDGGLVSKIPQHQGTLGEGHEEVLRVAGLMLPEKIQLGQRAKLTWADHEHRSLAERADAAVKLGTVLPFPLLAELVLNLTQDQIDAVKGQSPAIAKVVSSLQQQSPPPADPVAASNGSVA